MRAVEDDIERGSVDETTVHSLIRKVRGTLAFVQAHNGQQCLMGSCHVNPAIPPQPRYQDDIQALSRLNGVDGVVVFDLKFDGTVMRSGRGDDTMYEHEALHLYLTVNRFCRAKFVNFNNLEYSVNASRNVLVGRAEEGSSFFFSKTRRVTICIFMSPLITANLKITVRKQMGKIIKKWTQLEVI